MSVRGHAVTETVRSRATRQEGAVSAVDASMRATATTGRDPARLSAPRFTHDPAPVRPGFDDADPTVRAREPVIVKDAPACAPLPLPDLCDPAPYTAMYYVVSAVDDRGRLGDTTAAMLLGWTAGMPVSFSVLPGGTGLVVTRGGNRTLTGRGRLLLPVAVRRVLHLEAGDRVLVAGHADRLIVYTMATLDTMTAWLHNAHKPWTTA